jgi:hypothetical protein
MISIKYSISVNTNQQRESMEEGFVDKDGQAVIAKKMTRIVTTTRTTYDGGKYSVTISMVTKSFQTLH